ncbi:MAG: LPS-assembly protein LptD [Deltaproteobacteria bacterium]|nr:LPS-assembly protein LptD [Deltaproteobacteria bacterium]
MDHNLKDRVIDNESGPWEIRAEKMIYLQEEGLYVGEGQVVVRRGTEVLSADRARYNERTGMIEVQGNVFLESKGDMLRAREAVFNLQSQTGRIAGGHIFLKENHYYISGETIEKTGPNTYAVRKCRVTTCDGERTDWSITGSEVKITLEGYGTVKNAVFRIRGYPALFFPYLIFPAKTKRQTGLLPPSAGYSSRRGAELEIPFFWAISDQMDATFYERYMTDRGYMQGLEYRYVAEGDSKGTFILDILSDKVQEKDLTDPDEVDLSPFPRTNDTRYWFRSRTDQQLPLGIRAKLDMDYVSDQDYLKEFGGSLFGYYGKPDLESTFERPLEDIRSPTRRSALRLDRDREDYSIQAFSSYYQRPENPTKDSTPQSPAGLNFSFLPKPFLSSPLFFQFDTDFNTIWREDGQKGARTSLTPQLAYPMWFGKIIEVEPSLGYTLAAQRFDHSEDGRRRQTKDAYFFQTRFSTALEKTFDVAWGEATKLKHKISPSLTYRYRVNRDNNLDQPWFEPMDREGNNNLLILAFENFLDARHDNKKGEANYRQWVAFSLAQAYDISEERRSEEQGVEKRPFLPLEADLTVNPYKSIYLDATAGWDHYEKEIAFADIGFRWSIERSRGKQDSISLDYRHVKETGEDGLNLAAHVNLAGGFSAGAFFYRDMSRKESVEERFYLDYESQCWGVRVTAERLDGKDSVMVIFRLLGLGEFGAK